MQNLTTLNQTAPGSIEIKTGRLTGSNPALLVLESGTSYLCGAKIASITITTATDLAGVLKVTVAGTDYYVGLYAASNLTGE
jgi:phage tail sheath gpL-like